MAASYTARGRSHVTSRLLRLWAAAWMFSGSELHTGGEDGSVQNQVDPQGPSRSSCFWIRGEMKDSGRG